MPLICQYSFSKVMDTVEGGHCTLLKKTAGTKDGMASIIDMITRQGYYVIVHDDKHFSKRVLESMRYYIAELKEEDWQGVTLKMEGDEELANIIGRTRHFLSDLVAYRLREAFVKDWGFLYPNGEAKGWTIESGSDPVPRRDIADIDHRNRVPASMLVALQRTTIKMWGWNRQVGEPRDFETYDLKTGDVFVFSSEMIYQIDQPLSIYMHAFIQIPEEDMKENHIAPFLTMEAAPMMSPYEFPPGMNCCPIYNCPYKPRSYNQDNLRKHFSRDHGVRVTKRQDRKQDISFKRLCN